ncbi:Hypothetical predicted protein [Olea europaea subsp. europaea]|uniref:Uncharacterized protein n=1 Tax=Olea europaea subsp. europaea TaxID=158383 RepID=A0A8S0S147_OLEEU|nr:Hypothetical predicted protein [Olea europaea subsp. europaea]
MAHGMQAMPRDVDKFLGQGRSLIYRHFWVRSVGHVREESWLRPECNMISRLFLGHAVQDISRMQPNFQVVSRTQCAGHVWDASGPWQGRSLIFKHFWEVSGHGVQGMSRHGVQALFGSHPGHGRVIAYFPGFFRQFLGHGVQAMSMTRSYLGYVLATIGTQVMSGTHPGYGRDAAKFSGIFGQFMGHGEHDMSKMQPDFQSFLVSGQGVQAMFGKSPGRVLPGISRQFLGDGVQAISRMRPYQGRVRATTGMQPNFQAISGHDVQCMSGYGVQTLFGTCPDCGRVVAYFSGIFRQFLGQCASHVHDAVGVGLIFKHFSTFLVNGGQVITETPPYTAGT